MLNLDLMRWLGLSYSCASHDSANLLCIGSLMDELLVTDWQRLRYSREVHVFGAGFMHARESTSEQFNRPIVIHGLRGRLSLSRCEEICGHSLANVTLGDPGLLVNEIFPFDGDKTYDVGVICHFNDFQADALSNLHLDGLKVVMINVLAPTAEFARLVASCKFILSSALHGIICADAYGVPNRHILLSERVEGQGYKFRDYYSVFSPVDYAPVDLRQRKVTVKDVQMWMANPLVSHAEVVDVQSNVMTSLRKIGDYVA